MSKRNSPDRPNAAFSSGAFPADAAAAEAVLGWYKAASRDFVRGNATAAVRAARRGLTIDPGHAVLAALEALAQQRRGDPAAAHRGSCRALVLAPGHAGSWQLRGGMAHLLGRSQDSLGSSRRALLLDPRDTAAAHNLFTAERERGDWPSAVAAGRRNRVLDPGAAAGAVDLGMLLLGLGRWAEGWPLYDRRLHLATARPHPGRLPQPYWTGTPDSGLGLAVWCDQNVGDEMQFAQLLPEVAGRVGRVVLECDPRLMPLFARSFPAIEVVPRVDPPDPRLLAPDIGAQIPQGHLGGLLRRDAASFARGPARWLVADPDRAEALRRRYQAWSEGRPVIGVAWRSSNAGFRGKNLPLERWGPVLRQDGALFLSVQYGDVADDLAAAQAATGVAVAHDPEIDALADLDGFAALLAATDLVISISNSTIHQACGLGRPVWGLLHVRPDWRWGVAGRSCPWFPSLTLYRQAERGAWGPVLEAVRRDLRGWLADRRAC